MSQANMDLGIFQEKKCTDGVYTRESAGYRVVATDAPSQHRGGVALFYRPSALFEVEAVQEYGPNDLSFEVAKKARRWYIIGFYLAPDDAEKIERVVTALGDRPRGTALIVAGDLNTDLGDTENDSRGLKITAAMMETGVEDMRVHFLPRKRKWGRERRTWSMVRKGPEREGKRTGGAGVTGNGQGTETGESGGEEEANRGGKKKGARWWGACKRSGGSTKDEVPIIYGTYNIRKDRNGGLESALRGMFLANMDLGIFQEMKCTDGIDTCDSSGYRVVATDAPSRHHGRFALFYRPSPLFEVEAVR